MKKIVRIFSAVANLQEQAGDQSHIGRRDSQLLHGEPFEIQSVQEDWAYGRSVLDGYTGHVRLTDIDNRRMKTTHAVATIHTNTYPAPDFKTQPSLTLSFMSRVAVDPKRTQDGFVALKGFTDTWIPQSHLIALKDLKKNPADIVETAMMFSGTPYIYGGRSARGIDCSGLVQIALQRNGVFCPRDADQQQDQIGKPVRLANIRRGDIVYFPGHVGIMVDDKNILNATVREMKVLIEPFEDMWKNYGATKADAVLAVRRLG